MNKEWYEMHADGVINKNISKNNVDIDKSDTMVNNSTNSTNEVIIKLTRRRWFILATFSLVTLINAFHWIEHNIIQDVIVFYYNQSLPEGIVAQNEAVNWLSMVYMLTYIPLVFPGMLLLDIKGLKLTVCIGALLTCIGAWIKCASVDPNRFWVLMLGQTICGIAQAFTLGVPPRLSSLWFGSSEISTATSIGVFGNQLGTAIGFVIPPLVVPSSLSLDEMKYRFYYLYFIVAGFCTLLCILSFVVIQDKPAIAPNYGQTNNTEESLSVGFRGFLNSLKNLFRNRNFILIFISYGVNTGAYYSISTLLNQILLYFYPNDNENIGYIGLVLVISGLFGAILGGIILDRTKAFKLTTFLMYALSLGSMVLFTFTIKINIWVVFGTAFLLGFFMTGYLPVGFEFVAELTYPEPEGTSSGLLNTSAQIFGIAFIFAQGRILNTVGVLYCNIFLCAVLAIGTILTLLTTSELRRQKAFNEADSINNESEQTKASKSNDTLNFTF